MTKYVTRTNTDLTFDFRGALRDLMEMFLDEHIGFDPTAYTGSPLDDVVIEIRTDLAEYDEGFGPE